MEMLKIIFMFAYIALLAIEVCFLACFCIVKLVKRHKKAVEELTESERLSEELKLSNEARDVEIAINKLVEDIIPASIKVAEESKIAGPLKKLVAISDIMLKCAENGIDWEVVKDIVPVKLEALIDFSKEVNAKGR